MDLNISSSFTSYVAPMGAWWQPGGCSSFRKVCAESRGWGGGAGEAGAKNSSFLKKQLKTSLKT